MLARKQYTNEFKLAAISLVLDQEVAAAEAARSMVINANILRRWIDQDIPAGIKPAIVDSAPVSVQEVKQPLFNTNIMTDRIGLDTRNCLHVQCGFLYLSWTIARTPHDSEGNL